MNLSFDLLLNFMMMKGKNVSPSVNYRTFFCIIFAALTLEPDNPVVRDSGKEWLVQRNEDKMNGFGFTDKSTGSFK